VQSDDSVARPTPDRRHARRAPPPGLVGVAGIAASSCTAPRVRLPCSSDGRSVPTAVLRSRVVGNRCQAASNSTLIVPPRSVSCAAAFHRVRLSRSVAARPSA